MSMGVSRPCAVKRRVRWQRRPWGRHARRAAGTKRPALVPARACRLRGRRPTGRGFRPRFLGYRPLVIFFGSGRFLLLPLLLFFVAPLFVYSPLAALAFIAIVVVIGTSAGKWRQQIGPTGGFPPLAPPDPRAFEDVRRTVCGQIGGLLFEGSEAPEFGSVSGGGGIRTHE